VERTSTYSGGKPSSKVTLQLNTVYEGPEGLVQVYTLDGVLWIVSEFYLDLTKTQNMADTALVAYEVFKALKNKGVERVYCLAGSQSAFDFNRTLGWESANHVINGTHEVMVKEL